MKSWSFTERRRRCLIAEPTFDCETDDGTNFSTANSWDVCGKTSNLEQESTMNLTKMMTVALVLGVGSLATFLLTGQAASAPTAELAKKCREMMIKAYPPLPAGSSTGHMLQQREYFRTCIAQNGKMENIAAPAESRGK